MRGVNLDATRLTAYDEYDGDDEYGSYDEAAFDREYGADLEALEEPYEDEAMDRGAAAAQSMDFGAAAPVNEFRGKFDPPLEPGAGEDASFDMDDVGALARSIEGHRRRREDVPVVTGITVAAGWEWTGASARTS